MRKQTKRYRYLKEYGMNRLERMERHILGIFHSSVTGDFMHKMSIKISDSRIGDILYEQTGIATKDYGFFTMRLCESLNSCGMKAVYCDGVLHVSSSD